MIRWATRSALSSFLRPARISAGPFSEDERRASCPPFHHRRVWRREEEGVAPGRHLLPPNLTEAPLPAPALTSALTRSALPRRTSLAMPLGKTVRYTDLITKARTDHFLLTTHHHNLLLRHRSSRRHRAFSVRHNLGSQPFRELHTRRSKRELVVNLGGIRRGARVVYHVRNSHSSFNVGCHRKVCFVGGDRTPRARLEQRDPKRRGKKFLELSFNVRQ